MNEMATDRLTDEQLANEYEEHKDDASIWSSKPRKIRARRGDGPSTMFSLRMTGQELTAIGNAAAARNMNVSDFIRKAAMATVAGETDLTEAVASARLEAVQREIRAFYESVRRI